MFRKINASAASTVSGDSAQASIQCIRLAARTDPCRATDTVPWRHQGPTLRLPQMTTEMTYADVVPFAGNAVSETTGPVVSRRSAGPAVAVEFCTPTE